jgi:hypothetical protein
MIVRNTMIAAILIMSMATACTTMRPVEPAATAAELRAKIQAGDQVRVITKTGERHNFRVAELAPTALVGQTVWSLGRATTTVEVPYESIAAIDARRFSPAKTTAAILVGAGTVLVISVAVAEVSLLTAAP